jgi:AraC family transcriptional regulator, arabinose operon regulatory protein
MRINSGYYRNDDETIVDTQYDIAVNSCGRYELVKQKEFKTIRPLGREDYQLLYVARGKGTFIHGVEEKVVEEGSVVLYLPGEAQCYCYTSDTSPIIYWLHFSGLKVRELLEENGLSKSHIFYVGIKNELALIFDKIIKELQLTQGRYFQLCNLYIKELITLCSRYMLEASAPAFTQNELLERAIQHFNENFNTIINIKDYAMDSNISCCWFIRSFKNYTGTTPAHYITNIRINKAKNLLHSSSFTIGEIADLIGYQNQLYFSRIFKKNVGLSPLEYRHSISNIL